jgi:cytochrome P450
MRKHLSEAPWLPFPPAEVMSHRGPALLARQAERHGPVLRWTMPHGALAGREIVLLVGPEANRLVLHTHRSSFSHEQGWTPYVGPLLLGKGLLNMDPPEHTRHRKLWNPAFTNAYMERYLPLIQQVIAQHTARWLEQGEVDLYQAMRELTFHVAASALVGLERSQRIEQLQKLFYTLFAERVTLFAERGSSLQNYDEHLPKALLARDELSGLLLELIAERRGRPVDQPSGDVLGLILQARDEDGERLGDEQVLGHLTILLLAGHETTSTLSAYVLYLLATLPEHRRRIEAELQALVGDSTGPISVGATRAMKTLDNFIAETGRLYSPVFTVPRQVVQEVEFADYTLPAGTIVRLALAAGHHLPRVFADPEAFDPDRFAPPREEDRRTPYGLVTFGGGPRLCIGVHFATIEVKVLAAHVLRSYHLKPASEEFPAQVGFTSTVVKNGIPMRVTARHRASHDATSEGL